MAPRPWHSSPPCPSIHTWSLEGLHLLPHLPGYTPVMKPARAGPQTRRSAETGQDLPHLQPQRGARWRGGRCANNPLRCSPGAYVPCVGQLHRACVCKHSSLVHTPPLLRGTAPWGSPPRQVVPIFPRLIRTQLQSSLAGATRTWAPRRPLSVLPLFPLRLAVLASPLLSCCLRPALGLRPGELRMPMLLYSGQERVLFCLVCWRSPNPSCLGPASHTASQNSFTYSCG